MTVRSISLPRLVVALVPVAIIVSLAPPRADAAPPVVASVSPLAGAANVPLLASGMMQIRFDQPMNQTAVLNAISVSPVNVALAWRANQSYRWLDDRTFSAIVYAVNPLDSFPASSTVTVTISTAATSLAGEKLSAAYQWSFTTKPRSITTTSAWPALVAAYQHDFGKTVPEPAYYYNASSGYWTSTAYLDRQLYRLYLLQDGSVLSTQSQPTFRPDQPLSVAVVAIDYGNTNIASVLGTLWVDAQNSVNTAYAQLAKTLGFAQPVQFTNVNFLVPSSQIANPTDKATIVNYVTSQGYSPSDFDAFVVLNLDAAHPAGGEYAGQSFIPMGYPFSATSFAKLDQPSLLSIAGAVYDHEFGHAFGWEHEWSPDYAISYPTPITEPTLYGWVDNDGDGISELLDATPYGGPTVALTPVLNAGTLANGATYFAGGLVAGSWAQVKGSGLSNTTRIWGASDFTGSGLLPTNLSGVQVLVNNLPAAVYYISPTQVSFQVPAGVTGTASVQVVSNGQKSAIVTAAATSNSPAIFPVSLNGTNYPAGVFLDGKLVGNPAIPGFRKAIPGDVIQLFATGLAVSPAGVFPVAGALSGVTVTIGTVVVTADYAGLVQPGEFQINFTVPNLPSGSYSVSIQVNGVSSPITIDTLPQGPLVLPM